MSPVIVLWTGIVKLLVIVSVFFSPISNAQIISRGKNIKPIVVYVGLHVNCTNSAIVKAFELLPNYVKI